MDENSQSNNDFNDNSILESGKECKAANSSEYVFALPIFLTEFEVALIVIIFQKRQTITW